MRAGEAAAEHLLARGRRRLAYIGAQLDQRTLLRGEGFRRALQKAGCYDPGWKSLRRGRPRWPSAANSSCSCWPASRRSTGVLLQRDLAQGALLEALRRGVKVPEQIAVLGFNDLPGSDCTVPRLSSIRTPREAIGRRAAEQLLALIAGKEVRDSALDMGFELMAREST